MLIALYVAIIITGLGLFCNSRLARALIWMLTGSAMATLLAIRGFDVWLESWGCSDPMLDLHCQIGTWGETELTTIGEILNAAALLIYVIWIPILVLAAAFEAYFRYKARRQ